MFKDVFYRNLQRETVEKMMKYSSLGFLREMIHYNFYSRQDFLFLPGKFSVFFLTAAELLMEGHLLM
jgi:hypothetical protein